MSIVVVGKQESPVYEITCTDERCQNIIRFRRDDVTMVNNSVMGRTTETTEGISCPDCRQILPFKKAKVATP